jgi:hypothetical protein
MLLAFALLIGLALLRAGHAEHPIVRVQVEDQSQGRTASSPGKMQELSEHATSAHAEASTIHSACLQHLQDKQQAMKEGLLQLFKKKGEDRYLILCKYGEDLWGIEIRDADGTSVTAFRPSDGSLQEVMRYILKIATRFKGDLSWLK